MRRRYGRVGGGTPRAACGSSQVADRATSWPELPAAHDRFFQDFNQQSHAAHGGRPKGRRSPAAVLGWVHGAWCDRAELDRLFRLRAMRVLDAACSLRFRHWRLYGERGLARKPAAVWITGETLTIEHATESLAQYGIALEADGHGPREVGEPRFSVTRYGSPQPFLPTFAEVEWHPARRLAPYRERRRRQLAERQAPLLPSEPGIAATG